MADDGAASSTSQSPEAERRVSIEEPDLPPETGVKRLWSEGRTKVRTTVESMRWEFTMLGIVLTYCAFIFVGLALDDPEVSSLFAKDTIDIVHDVFLCLDLTFLCWFMIELLLYLYAFGWGYFRDIFALVDASIVITSFVLTCIAVRTLEVEAKVVSLSLPILKVVRVVRVLRVVLAMTRISRSRERYRRRKMLGLQAPVTRVVELISELKRTYTEPGDEDAKMLQWTTELIAKEELYKASVHNHTGGRLTAEMADWMRSNLQVSLPMAERSQASAQSRMSIVKKGSSKSASRVTAEEKKEARVAELPVWLSQTLSPDGAVVAALARVDEWDFDVFALDDVTNHRRATTRLEPAPPPTAFCRACPW